MPLVYTPTQPDYVLPAPLDPTDLAGEDVSLRGGELLETPAGDWATLEKQGAARQSVEREAGASPNEFVRRPEWGMGLKASLMRSITKAELDRMVAAARRRLAENQRIDSLKTVSVRQRDELTAAGGAVTLLEVEGTVSGSPISISKTLTRK